jgi:hypothetical protein
MDFNENDDVDGRRPISSVIIKLLIIYLIIEKQNIFS